MAKMIKNHIIVEQNRYESSFTALNQQYTEGSGLLYAIFSTMRLLQQWGKPNKPEKSKYSRVPTRKIYKLTSHRL